MSGNGPPPIDSKSLLAQMRQRPRASKVVDFPGGHYKSTPLEKVRIVVTPCRANAQSQLAAHVRMRDEIKVPIAEWETETGRAIVGDITAKEMLSHWVWTVDGAEDGTCARIFQDSKDVEGILSADEVAVLFNLCQQVQLELGPRLQVLTDHEVDMWIERLKDGFDPLAYLQSPDLALLIRGLHRRLVESTGSQLPDFPQSNTLDLRDSGSMTFATDTTSSGEQPEQQSAGTTSETLTPEQTLAMARSMAGHD